MRAVSLLLAFLFAGPVWADVALPKELSVKPGRLLKIAATTDATSLKWVASDDVDLIESESGKWAIFLAPAPGKYKVHVVGSDAKGNLSHACCVVTVEGAPPTPPGPGPTPPPPGPVDPLTASFQAAYTTDPASVLEKQQQLKALADLYAAAAQHVQDTTAVKTVGDIRSDLASASKTLGKSLVGVRKLIAAAVAGVLPTAPGTVLTPDLRASAAVVFGRVANALKGVK